LDTNHTVKQDIAGAQSVGMRGILIVRSGEASIDDGVPVIRSLIELPALL